MCLVHFLEPTKCSKQIFLSTRKHFEYKYNKSRTIRSNSRKAFLNCRQNIQPIIKNKKGDIILKDTKYLQLHVYAKQEKERNLCKIHFIRYSSCTKCKQIVAVLLENAPYIAFKLCPSPDAPGIKFPVDTILFSNYMQLNKSLNITRMTISLNS